MSEVVPLLKFTPSAQSPEVLEAITVQREPVIAKLVEVALETAGGARHQLLIGPRGIGKTHILSLIASRVRAENADAVTLAWLDEDPWGVGSYEKFLAAILGRVAAERSDEELEAEADALHATRDESGGRGEQALRDAVGDSRLVLLVENLDEIFRRIGDNGQERFRAFIEDWQQMLVIGTAPQLFEGVQLHESPFYGFFAITHLEELSLDSAGELMRRVAELRGDRALVKFLGTEMARRRLAAVEALAGGHPRIWLLLSGCVSINAIDELVPLFLEALDDLTPYYQDRLRELGDQQQELVVLLSETGGALSNRALSERSGVPQNQVATILRQLTDRGYVRRAEVSEDLAKGDARMSYWELREPLMRLCLDVKQARGKPLRMVVEFLRAWYGPRLLDELVALPPTSKLADAYIREAFRTFKGALSSEDIFLGSPSEVLARAEAGLAVAPDRWELQVARATGLLMVGQFDGAEAAYEDLVSTANTDETRMALELQLAVVKKRRGEKVDPEPLAEGMVRLSQDNPSDAAVQELAAVSLSALEADEKAAIVFPRALQFAPEDKRLLFLYGKSLTRLERYEEAVEAFEKAVDLEPADPSVHAALGFALGCLERSQEAVVAYDRALDLDPRVAACWEYKGVLLNDLGRYEEALESFDGGLKIDPDNATMHGGRGSALLDLGRYEEALSAFGRASELDPDSSL
jgi:tetratricopeptide (TPR) repeat protein